jgi:O-antigen biosynthesis protein
MNYHQHKAGDVTGFLLLEIVKMIKKTFSVVIPVYNKFAFTKSCLQDLSKLPADHEIIIVDNGSTDETRANLEFSKEINYYRNEKNYGFAQACNRGYSITTAPNVLFLNNDIRVKSNYSDWTQPLLKECPHAIVGPTMGQLDSQMNFVQEANRMLPGTSYLSGWCIASSKNIWDKLEIRRDPLALYDQNQFPQIFSEEFGLAYFEDSDASLRARQLGIPLKVVEVPVVHFGKVSSKQLNTYQLYKQAQHIFIKKWKPR